MAPRNFDTFDPSSLQKTEDDVVVSTNFPSTHTSSNAITSPIQQNEIINDEKEFKPKIVWKNVLIFIYLHIAAIYGIYLCAFAKYQTLIFALLLEMAGGLGITAGAHRLWAHRTYKAKLPLRILLAIFQTIAVQNHIYEWSRDHRVHHKYSETNADPHNAKRGFFFSHIGWLLVKKHPDVISKGKRMYLDDLLEDPVVRIQKKFYKPLTILLCFILPTIIPVYAWNESFTNAYFISGVLKYIVTLHVTWLVNSVAHMFGNKPYDKRINPSENLLVSFLALGEGFHNYHHTFPQDYSTSEYGWNFLNPTRAFIDFMALIGQAYDRNKMEKDTILKRKIRTGNFNTMDEKIN